MFEFVAGIVVGAAFSPFWMKLFTLGKAWVTQFMAKDTITEKDEGK